MRIGVALCIGLLAPVAAAQTPQPATQPQTEPATQPQTEPAPEPAPAPAPLPQPPPATGWDVPGQPLPPPAPAPRGRGAYPPFGYPYGYRPWGVPMQPPREIPAEEGRAPPPGYHLQKRIQRGLVIGGSITFGALYLASLIAGGFLQEQSRPEQFAPLFVPVVGPFITIGTANATAMPSLLLGLDGVGQALGLGLLIGGLLYPEDFWVRDDSFRVTLLPMSSGGGVGVSSRW